MTLFKKLGMLTMAMAVCFSLYVTPTYAAVVSFTEDDVSKLGDKVSTSTLDEYVAANITSPWASIYLTTDSNGANTENDTYLVNGTSYYIREGYTGDQFKEKVLTQYKSAMTTEKTTELTNNINVNADTSGATQALSGLVPYINIFLGIIVTLITIGLAVFTAFDVCYIVFPVFRNKCEKQKMSGQGAMVTQSANGGTKLRWVSEEAQYAANHASLEQGSNPLMNYLKNRVVAYVFVAIILFILLTGNISIITNLALKAVSGIMDVLDSLS